LGTKAPTNVGVFAFWSRVNLFTKAKKCKNIHFQIARVAKRLKSVRQKFENREKSLANAILIFRAISSDYENDLMRNVIPIDTVAPNIMAQILRSP
jgi:hypothetical protein